MCTSNLRIKDACLNRRQASLFLCTCASHPCRVFCVSRSSYPCLVFCIARLSRIYVVCSTLHVLCRTLVAHMCSVSRARRASVSYVLCCMFCVTRSSCTCILYRALVAYIYSVSRARRASVLQILRCTLVALLHRVLCVARLSRVLSYTFITLMFDKLSAVRAQIFAHVPGSHDVPLICTEQAGSKH